VNRKAERCSDEGGTWNSFPFDRSQTSNKIV
jgi:hypothetical protein